eukprot:gb/GEZN01005289.1/.p1 GENE.gb/GEZN01005289.1/~~gb/GEZN01005289.1/.p1  ORF type:complete len:541 (-),score=73.66 gb/GEZN01005289.1/:115-1737(-)
MGWEMRMVGTGSYHSLGFSSLFPVTFVSALLVFLLSLSVSGVRAAGPSGPGLNSLNNKAVSSIAFASCRKHNVFLNQQRQTLLSDVLDQEPELFIWMGDIIYNDPTPLHAVMMIPTEPQVMQKKWDEAKALPEYQALLRKMPVIGIWDDHDYGQNDGDRHHPYKKPSQQQLLDFLDEPVHSPRRHQDGAYASYEIGGQAHRIRVILLDTRAQQDAKLGQILGPDQWEWLEQELTTAQARHTRLTILVSSIQALTSQRFFGEGWRYLPQERARLLELVARVQPGPVFLVSGDVHFAQLAHTYWKTDTHLQPLYELTLSGLTHSLGFTPPNSLGLSVTYFGKALFPFHYLQPVLCSIFRGLGKFNPWNHATEYPLCPYFGRHYGTLHIDWQPVDPQLTWRVHGLDWEADKEGASGFVGLEDVSFSEKLDWQTHVVREWNFSLSHLTVRGLQEDFPLSSVPPHHPFFLGSAATRRTPSSLRDWIQERAEQEAKMAQLDHVMKLSLKQFAVLIIFVLLVLFLVLLCFCRWLCGTRKSSARRKQE